MRAAIAFLLFTMFTLSACDKKTEDRAEGSMEENSLPLVRLGEVKAADHRFRSRHLVLLQAERKAQISTRIAGQVRSLDVREQQEVKQGELLLSLADVETRGALTSAKAIVSSRREELADAKRELEEAQKLIESGGETRRNLERFESKVVIAKAALRQADGQLLQAKDRQNATQIKAPFAGVVSKLEAELGEFVNLGTSILELMDLKTLAAELPLSEKEVIQGDALEYEMIVRGEKIPARLDWIAQAADDDTATFKARLLVDNTDRRLRAGESAEVLISGKEKNLEKTIPIAALRWDGNESYVFVVEGGGLGKVPVKRLQELDGRMEVEGALNVGQKVVVSGPSTLAAGDRVRERASATPKPPVGKPSKGEG